MEKDSVLFRHLEKNYSSLEILNKKNLAFCDVSYFKLPALSALFVLNAVVPCSTFLCI